MAIATNYRRGVLDSAILQCCQVAIRKVCRDFGAELREFNSEDDHMHLRVEDPQKVALSTWWTPWETTSLDAQQWLICICVALSIIVVSEVRKAIRRRTAAPGAAGPESPTEG